MKAPFMREINGAGLCAGVARRMPDEIAFQMSLMRLKAAVGAADRALYPACSAEEANETLALIERSLARRAASDPARGDVPPKEGQK